MRTLALLCVVGTGCSLILDGGEGLSDGPQSCGPTGGEVELGSSTADATTVEPRSTLAFPHEVVCPDELILVGTALRSSEVEFVGVSLAGVGADIAGDPDSGLIGISIRPDLDDRR